MPARRGATTAGLVLHHSGIHAALGASVADASQEIDPRLKWMAIEGQMEMSEAQRISDEQPHARSLCALADRIAGGEEVFVSPWRVIHLLVTPEHDGPVRMSDLAGADLPEWLKTMCQNRDPVHPRLSWSAPAT